MATSRLNGTGSLNYMGVNAPQPPNLITMDRRPTVTDGVGFSLGTIWLIPQAQVGATPQKEVWMLVGNRQNVFIWKHLRGSTGPTPEPFGILETVYDTPGSFTYTPTDGMINVTVQCVAGGGGSVGWSDSGAGARIIGEGGSGGSYCKRTFIASEIGVSQSFVVGTGGAAGLSSDPVGGTGGVSSFGSFMSAGGGLGGGNGGPPNNASLYGGIATGGDLNIPGCGRVDLLSYDASQPSIVSMNSHSNGGNSAMGFGVGGIRPITGINANQGVGYGAGAGGIVADSDEDATGAAGTNGVVVITEYF